MSTNPLPAEPRTIRDADAAYRRGWDHLRAVEVEAALESFQNAGVLCHLDRTTPPALGQPTR